MESACYAPISPGRGFLACNTKCDLGREQEKNTLNLQDRLRILAPSSSETVSYMILENILLVHCLGEYVKVCNAAPLVSPSCASNENARGAMILFFILQKAIGSWCHSVNVIKTVTNIGVSDT